jgi:hypothetical protein
MQGEYRNAFQAAKASNHRQQSHVFRLNTEDDSRPSGVSV